MEDAIPQGIPGDGAQSGHEDTTLRVSSILLSAGVLVGVIIVCQILLAWWMVRFRREEARVKALYPVRQEIPVGEFPNPRLQENPPVDLMRIRQEERNLVSSYGWVDRKAGIARIPVDRAMDILARKGLPRVAAKPRTPGAPRNTSIPPAGKREEAELEVNPPVPTKKADRSPPRTNERREP